MNEWIKQRPTKMDQRCKRRARMAATKYARQHVFVAGGMLRNSIQPLADELLGFDSGWARQDRDSADAGEGAGQEDRRPLSAACERP